MEKNCLRIGRLVFYKCIVKWWWLLVLINDIFFRTLGLNFGKINHFYKIFEFHFKNAFQIKPHAKLTLKLSLLKYFNRFQYSKRIWSIFPFLYLCYFLLQELFNMGKIKEQMIFTFCVEIYYKYFFNEGLILKLETTLQKSTF